MFEQGCWDLPLLGDRIFHRLREIPPDSPVPSQSTRPISINSKRHAKIRAITKFRGQNEAQFDERELQALRIRLKFVRTANRHRISSCFSESHLSYMLHRCLVWNLILQQKRFLKSKKCHSTVKSKKPRLSFNPTLYIMVLRILCTV